MSATKYKLRWTGEWGRQFETVRLEISVGQEYHEGEKLQTAVDWAKRNFNRAVLIVGDRIQGYNLAISTGISLKQAFEISTKKGDEWLQRNADVISGMEVTRWNDWLHHPEYLTNRAQISRLYASNDEFREKVQRQISNVWERRKPQNVKYGRFFKLSEQFVLEESAVFACAYKDLKGVSAYPGDFLELWGMFAGKEVEGAPEGFKHSQSIRLQFKRREPQAA